MNTLKSAILGIIASVALISCGGANSKENLSNAAALADSIARADAGGSVVVASPGLQMSFEIADPEIPVSDIGRELFEVFAARQLKTISAADITTVCNALRADKAELDVVLNSPSGESAVFNFTPQRIITLQRAKNSELNIPAARTQLIVVAEKMVPNPGAHAGAVRVETSVVKGFLEYNIIFPDASTFERAAQGLLTKNYFNPLKQQYADMGGLAEPVVEMLTSMGIDGVRIVYSAENSDKNLKQAFPWREIKQPVEE